MPPSPDGHLPGLVDLPCACATARRVSRILTRLYDSHLRPHGIESTQFALLSMLAATGPITQAGIGLRLGYDKTTLSRNLKVMRERGWLDVAEGRNARERPCVITPEGRTVLKAAQPAWRRAQAALRASMAEDEWASMWTAFRAVTGAGETARQRPGGRRTV